MQVCHKCIMKATIHRDHSGKVRSPCVAGKTMHMSAECDRLMQVVPLLLLTYLGFYTTVAVTRRRNFSVCGASAVTGCIRRKLTARLRSISVFAACLGAWCKHGMQQQLWWRQKPCTEAATPAKPQKQEVHIVASSQISNTLRITAERNRLAEECQASHVPVWHCCFAHVF